MFFTNLIPIIHTFEQVGFLSGGEIVNGNLDNGEWGIALEHLLYMIHESETNTPPEDICLLHAIADKYNISNKYASETFSK